MYLFSVVVYSSVYVSLNKLIAGFVRIAIVIFI